MQRRVVRHWIQQEPDRLEPQISEVKQVNFPV